MAGQVYPDQSLYPCNSVPMLVERINNALQRADQIEHAEGNVKVLLQTQPCVATAIHCASATSGDTSTVSSGLRNRVCPTHS